MLKAENEGRNIWR